MTATVETQWISDAIAIALRDTLELEFVALNPGASFRGLHDSLVNVGGPTMLVCLHEEHAVAIAHGYAKVTERPMAVILHSNVGLMHGSMAVYNAWCDRVPMVILGGTGPMDANKRRPWIDWIHTTTDQAAIVRAYTKWDDQPSSLPAALDALVRANNIARTEPCGPTYVCLDANLQEARIETPPHPRHLRVHVGSQRAVPQASEVARVVEALKHARHPVIVVGRVSRSERSWNERIQLVESTGAMVVTDLKTPSSFPTMHPAHVGVPGYFLDEAAKAALRNADVIVSLDAIDLAGVLKQAFGNDDPGALIVSITLDRYAARGWTMDMGGVARVDIDIAAHPDAVVPLLLAEFSDAEPIVSRSNGATSLPERTRPESGPVTMASLGRAIHEALGERQFTLTRVPLGWVGDLIPFVDPFSYLGYDGGGGVGSGPGMAVGSALALKDAGRLPVAILGDGDFLMGCTALWTAVAHEIPLLVVVANNQSYYNDVVHQERVARDRNRPLENKWQGQQITAPTVDIVGMARAQGAVAFGQVSDAADLPRTLAEAIEKTQQGAVCIVDVLVAAEYGASLTKVLSQESVAP